MNVSLTLSSYVKKYLKQKTIVTLIWKLKKGLIKELIGIFARINLFTFDEICYCLPLYQWLKIKNIFFDSKGFLYWIELQVKLILSNICTLKKSSDSEVPLAIEKSWKLFLNLLKIINDVSFDHYLFTDQNDFISVELHVHCDTFEILYSAVIYRRSILKDKIIIKIASAKLKVVRNRDFQIQRIELLSCVLLSKLISTIINIRQLGSKTVYLWWIKRVD